MRNGNQTGQQDQTQKYSCSYRTYEEWKPQWRIWVGFCGSIVLTVPMRNGNKYLIITSFETVPFLPYLWGMETLAGEYGLLSHWLRSYRTYEEWKQSSGSLQVDDATKVLTVPMRNGNISVCTVSNLVSKPFLPYLWGMETMNLMLNLVV